MKVIIFNSQSAFSGIVYNFNKVLQNRAQLMACYNFSALQILKSIKAQDFLDYLSIKSISNRVKKIQFHATIICKSREKNQHELTHIAHQWMQKMGFSEQPYLIFFHSDTSENHIHIVSSRVSAKGNYIGLQYEGVKAYEHLNEVLGIDTKKQAINDFSQALTYKLSSRREFLMLLHAKKYILRIKSNELLMIRHGRVQGNFNLNSIYHKFTAHSPDLVRRDELKEIFNELSSRHSTAVKKVAFLVKNPPFSPFRYTSDFIKALKEQHQIELVFSGSKNRLPADYTIIDHSSRQLFNGKDIMPIENLIRPQKHINYQQESLQQHHENYHASISSDLFKESLLMLSSLNFEITPDTDDSALLRSKLVKKRYAYHP